MGQIDSNLTTYQTQLPNRKYLLSQETKNNGLLCFDFVDKLVAKKMIEENHYSKSWYHSMGKINVGVFQNDILLGVASFGAIKVASSYKKIRKDIEKHEVIELNRLWIDDKLKKNAESILISKSIKLIKKYHPEIRVIQSFADGRLGCGTIYQASNFGYYGFHETEFFEDKESGRCYHEMVFHFASRPIVITRNLEMMQNRFRKFITRTYRYLYLIDKQIDVLYQEQEYVKEGVFKEYLDWQFDAEEVDRQIKNCLKYHFSKLGKPKITFSFGDEKYKYTKEMWEKNIHPKKLVLESKNPLFRDNT